MQSVLPLLMAAVRAGAAIPSSTLSDLGLDLADDSWQTLNKLQSHVPVHLDSDADGNPIARGRIPSSGYIEELDEELVVDNA